MKSVRILEHRAMRKNVVAMTVTLTGERSVCAARLSLSSCETYSPSFLQKELSHGRLREAAKHKNLDIV